MSKLVDHNMKQIYFQNYAGIHLTKKNDLSRIYLITSLNSSIQTRIKFSKILNLQENLKASQI